MRIYLTGDFCFLIPNHTASTASAVKKTLLAQLEPPQRLVNVLKEI
jgi:hypothetical protein